MLGALFKVLSSWPFKATIKLAKGKMHGGLISAFAAMQAPIPPKIIGEIDAMWAHAEQFFPSFPDWIMEHDEKALAANALVFWAVELVDTDKKYAAVLLSAAGFCVYDVDQAKFTNDPRFNLMMRGAATVAQGKGLDFYSNLLETDEPF
ncbi:hypothetical protein [Pseudomonas sp. GM80]|uniref:hypothetical protein n=1 Tax=Pseudomonas sp. GM80 TaxID=1144339 RepID=UPI00026FD1C1|nr:hypothetical protein [Pseudomonas sp. GM80]EJN23179.1 hypothetical protein PMI37_04746 [Pseudomonas sp. GM80]